jgi:phosphate transport system substrate-binding protein
MRQIIVVMLVCSFLISCGTSTATVPPTFPQPTAIEITPIRKITFAGSTTVHPLVEQMAAPFKAKYPYIDLEIAAGGSVVGINAIRDGQVDIGMSSRDLREDEERTDIVKHRIALDVLAIVVHPDNQVPGLTLEQLRQIYFGEITNWREVGGRDLPIRAVVREVSSGTRGAFDDIVLGDDQDKLSPNVEAQITAGEVEAVVADDESAIGYVGFGNIRPDVRIVAIDNVLPSPQTAASRDYKLVRPLLLLTGKLSQPIANEFITFAQSPEGRIIIEQAGWVVIPAS